MVSSEEFLKIPVEELDQVIDDVDPCWDQLRGKRILITGGTGFIGKWLLASFLRANRRLSLSSQAIILSRRPKSFLSKFPELDDAAELVWLEKDVRQITQSDAPDCSFAIHAATDVSGTADPLDILETCVLGTRRVLDVLTISNAYPCRLLLLSSGAVYGPAPIGGEPISEDCLVAPNTLLATSAYGEGKRISELLCAIFAAKTNLEYAVARCFAFVGPHLPLDKHFAIGNFILSSIRNENILIHGDGTPVRSYLYVSDLVHWLWTMLFKAPTGRVYNVGGSEPVSISDLANRVNTLLGGKGKLTISNQPVPGAASQIYVPSITRVASELDLKPTIPLDEAILRTARWATNSMFIR